MKAALYARVSTSDGSQTVENQLAELRAWAERLGYQIVQEYVDQASGTKGSIERPGLDRALRDAHERRFDVLLIWALDRLSRQGIAETASLLGRLRAAGVAVRSYQESWLDTSTPGIAELLTAVFAWVAQQERNRLVERIRAGMARAAKRGTKSGKAIGRPARSLDGERARFALARASGSLERAAKIAGVSRRTLVRRLQG